MRQFTKAITTIIILAAVLTSVYIGIGVFNRSYALPSTASIKALKVGIYWDSALTQRVTAIDWGFIAPGGTAQKVVFIQNQANFATTLATFADGWQPPEVQQYVTYSWNYSGNFVQVDEVLPVKMTLAVAQNVTGITAFSFNITVTVMG